MSTSPPGAPHPDPRSKVTRRAVVVWGAAVLFYIVAITGRTSFGVAGVDAIDRFGVDASRIAVFTAVQIGVYALAQIPVGLLIDRFGSRKVLVTGAVLMGIGQIVLGLTGNYFVAIAARVLIGAGDASAFLSVMRLLPFWFPARITPLFGQLTASLGQIGQFISAVPFLALLSAQGWTTAFVSLGAVGILIAIAAGVAVSDTPDNGTSEADPPAVAAAAGTEPGQIPEPALEKKKARFFTTLSQVVRHPLSWQAFFIHWSGMLNQIVFTLLWGVPLMTLGMGFSNAQAGLVLTVNTLAAVAAGPLLGFISARAGYNRDLAVLVLAGIIGAAWIIFLLSPTPRSLAAMIVLNIVMSLFTPVSNFGFDNIRARVDRAVVATSTGLGNMGGFLAGMVAAQLVGLTLDLSSDGAAYDWSDFRLAWIAVLVIWGIGMTGVALTRVWVKRWERGPGEAGVRIVDKR